MQKTDNYQYGLC